MTLRCLSLFSGCGGLDLGLQRAGFEIVLANDVASDPTESHRLNFPHTPIHFGSATEIASDRNLVHKILREGRPDLVAGGPPCPPYSKSRFYRKEKPRALADPTGIETLGAFIDVLRATEPRAFLFENVPGFAYAVHREALEYLLASARQLGYVCEWRVLNAADFGVPQIRERFFLVGLRRVGFVWPSPTYSDNAVVPGLLPWRTAGDVLSDLDTEKNADDQGHYAGGKFHGLLCQVPPGQNYLFFTKERGHASPVFKWRSRYWSFLLKLSPDRPAWTIQARRSNNMGPFHWRNRILRIEEVKRLQTFPDDWKLVGTVESQWRQLGNAVPPQLAEDLGRALVSALEANREPEGVRPNRTYLRQLKILE